jgi:hypothetical protein
VTIYTDGVHLICDDMTDAALHVFAAKVGFPRSWYQGDHYDVTTRAAALRVVTAGAVLIDIRDLGRLTIRCRRQRRVAQGVAEAPEPVGLHDPAWSPVVLDATLAADKNTELLRRFAPGRRIGRRGTDHL